MSIKDMLLTLKDHWDDLVRTVRYDLPEWMYQFTLVEWIVVAAIVVFAVFSVTFHVSLNIALAWQSITG